MENNLNTGKDPLPKKKMAIISTANGIHVQKLKPSTTRKKSVKTVPPALPQKVKYLTAASIFYGTFALGCAVNTIGPSLTTFQRKYDTDDATISKVFIVTTVCFLVAALSAGFIFSKVNRQLAVTFTFGALTIVMFVIPLSPTLPVFFVAAGSLDLFGAFYDIAQFVWIPEMMQKACPPYIQAQHLAFAIGANLSGFIVAPFLVDSGPSRLFTPFAIIGILVLLAMISQILLIRFFPYYPPPPEEPEKSTNPSEEPMMISESTGSKTKSKAVKWPWQKTRLAILTCCFFAAQLAMEVSSFKFFPKVVQNSELHLSEKEAAYVFTGMMSAFAIGRVIGIFTVLKVDPKIILWVNICLMLIAHTLLLVWGQNSKGFLWAASIIMGLGLSTMLALFTAFIERFLAITDYIGSLILVCASLGAAASVWVIGSFVETNPIVLTYQAYACLAVIIVTYGTLSYLTFKDKTRYV